MRLARTLFLFSAAVLAATALPAQSKPDFSGTWKLNIEKSDLGGAPIESLKVVIEQKDPQFKYTATGSAGGQNFEETETITTDGKPGQDSHGNTSTAHWDGATLVGEVSAPDGTLLFTSRLTMSADGKTCTRDYAPTSDDQPKRHEIYEKQ